MIRPAEQDRVAQRLVQAADLLLEDKGFEALSTRGLAEAAGTTTMAIYSRFGSKPGLLDAVYREGYADLAERQEAVLAATADPIDRLLGLCLTFREVALDHPGRYDLMMGRLPGLRTSAESLAMARAMFDRLADVVRDAVLKGVLAPGDPHLIAHQIVAHCHGLVAVERSGFSPVTDHEAAWVAGIDTLLRGLICKPRSA